MDDEPEHLTVEDRWKLSWSQAVAIAPGLVDDPIAKDFHRVAFYSGVMHTVDYISKADPEKMEDLDAELSEFRGNPNHFLGGE